MTNKTYSFKVSENHQIHVATFGSAKAQAILYLHGGPGLGCAPKDRQFFVPEKHFVIFLDQRASGKSIASQPLKENTTQDLMADITFVLDYFQLDKVRLFGGSWGATLSLLYAIHHPERVTSMILRGVFLADQLSLDWFYNKLKKQQQIWDPFINVVPVEYRPTFISYYYQMMCSKEKSMAEHFAITYLLMLARLEKPTVSEEEIRQSMSLESEIQKITIQVHFEHEHFYIPDGFILNNTHLISHIPTWIVHGMDDKICSVTGSRKLTSLMDNATLYTIENAGHSAFDPHISKKLKELASLYF